MGPNTEERQRKGYPQASSSSSIPCSRSTEDSIGTCVRGEKCWQHWEAFYNPVGDSENDLEIGT